MTVAQFEALEKDYILIRKLQAMVSASAFVGDSEVHDEFQHRNTKIKFEYAVITQGDILKGLHPTDEELKAFYERNKASYDNSIPEKRQIKYALVDMSKIAAAAPVTDQDLQGYYDQHRDEYRVPEEVKVRHILIKTPLPVPGAERRRKSGRRGARESRRCAEASQGGRRFRQASGKIFGRSWHARKAAANSAGSAAAARCRNSKKLRFRFRRGRPAISSSQLWVPYHPGGRQA